jgi:hypothetical protein
VYHIKSFLWIATPDQMYTWVGLPPILVGLLPQVQSIKFRRMHHGWSIPVDLPAVRYCGFPLLSSLAMSARLSHSAIGSPYDRTPAHCPNAANLRPSPWWSSSGVTATTFLHLNWLLTTTLRRNKRTHKNTRTPPG